VYRVAVGRVAVVG